MIRRPQNPLSTRGVPFEQLTNTALPCTGKGDHPNELDLAEVQIQVNQESKETFDFDQGTRKYGHIKFSQSIGLPPKSLLACLLQASADISTDAKSAQPKLATLCFQEALQNTVHTKTSRTLVQIQKF